MSRLKTHARIGLRTFCGRFWKDVQKSVPFRNDSNLDGQPGAERVDCAKCWRMAE